MRLFVWLAIGLGDLLRIQPPSQPPRHDTAGRAEALSLQCGCCSSRDCCWNRSRAAAAKSLAHGGAHPGAPPSKQENPPGRREKLELGTLFLPAGLKSRPASRCCSSSTAAPGSPKSPPRANKVAVISIQAGSGSATYAGLFKDPARLHALLEEAETKAGVRFGRVMLGGWSAGCGAIRQILQNPRRLQPGHGALMIDGIHTDYAEGKPGPLESKLGTRNLEIWLQLARDAVAGKKRADRHPLRNLPRHLRQHHRDRRLPDRAAQNPRRPVLKPGPMGLQQLSERAPATPPLGYAGNSAPDHVDQLHSLPEFLKWLHAELPQSRLN